MKTLLMKSLPVQALVVSLHPALIITSHLDPYALFLFIARLALQLLLTPLASRPVTMACRSLPAETAGWPRTCFTI